MNEFTTLFVGLVSGYIISKYIGNIEHKYNFIMEYIVKFEKRQVLG